MSPPPAVLAATLAVVAATGAGCSDSSGDGRPEPPAAVVTERPAVTFAPLVHLVEGERARPIGAREFIDHSSLTMANEPCFSQETVAVSARRLRMGRDEPAPVLEAARLGGPRPYRQRGRAPDCVGHSGPTYATDEHTRPFDRGRPGPIRPHEGFYLDLLTSRHGGTAKYRRDGDGQLHVRGAPVYYDLRAERGDGRPAVRIDYWLLYGLDSYPGGGEEAARALIHEGDWERISVLLGRRGGGRDRWTPLSVDYRIHGRWQRVPWRSVEVAAAADARPATHPVVYAARGNHAPYPDAGRTVVRLDAGRGLRYRIPDERRACSDCPRWSAWRDLRPVRSEPWYGYGGAWGAVGSTAGTSSPIGPSPYSR